MGINQFSYKNLRRNRWRNINTILRIALGVIIFLILVGSGIGINTVLGTEQGDNIIVSDEAQNQMLNTTLGNINSTINSFLGPDLSNSVMANGIRALIRNLISIVDVLASIIFLVGIFGVNYAMDMNLNERKREIGLIKSLGFNRKEIMLSLILEAAFFGLIGAIIGTFLVLLGIIILSGLIKIEIFSIAMPLWLPVLTISLTTMFSALLPLYSIWYHSNKDPEEALRL